MFVFAVLPILAMSIVGLLGAGLLSSCLTLPPVPNFPVPPASVGVQMVRVKLSTPGGDCRIAVTGAYHIRCQNGAATSTSALPSCEVTCRGGYWHIGNSTYTGREIAIEPVASNCFYVGSTCYRGSLHLVSPGGDTVIAVNHVDLESYLAGVLPKELLTTWSLEAYKSLAVAARTFALYQRSTSGAGHDYDLGDSESSQVYGGYTAECSASNARRAVEATRGMVLTYNGQIFLAQYSASCGGVVNGAYVIRNAPADAPLMGGQACDDCRNCPHYRWGPVRVYKSELYQAIMARYPQAASPLGGVSALNIASQTPYGRAIWIDVQGPTGQHARLRAEDIRLCWNMSLTGKPSASARRLYSMNCTIVTNPDSFDFTNGHGFGHGVGLCQWGAQTKAANGWKFNQILAFYYPGARIVPAY
jgi:stage II sporulation protein D